MKYLFILFLMLVTNLNAQTDLKYDKRFVQCEDKWVALQMNKDSSYNYGFIYIDAQAGLTLNYEGKFTITPYGQYIPEKFDSATIKVRLTPNNVLVAVIPPNRYEELGIKAIPNWLKSYKSDTLSIERLYKWGFMYNGWGECTKALTYLEKAIEINPNFKGLAVELAFSYNCLNQFDQAINVLQNALKTNPTDAYTYKELIYAQLKKGELDSASKSCKKAIKNCKDKSYNGENCYNLLVQYFFKKDKKNFDLWLKDAKKWTANNDMMNRNIKIMETELNQ